MFLWFTLVAMPIATPFDQLDFSWNALLAHDWREGLQSGIDFVFTYGPFGWLLSPPLGFEPDLFITKVIAALAVSLAMALVMTSFLRQMPSTWERLLAAVVLLYLAPTIPEGPFLLSIIAGTSLVLYRADCGTSLLVFVCLLIAAFGLVKFTNFMVALPCVGAMAAVSWRRRSWRRAAALVACWLGAFLGCWLSAGQHLANIPEWLRMSSSIASGYNEAMGYGGVPLQMHLGQACTLLLFATLAALVCMRPRSFVHLAVAVVCGAALFVAWKGGFVRHDDGHARLLFAFAAFAPLVLLPAIAAKVGHGRWLRVPGLLVTVLAVLGMEETFGSFGGLRQIPDRVLARAPHTAGLLADMPRYRALLQEVRNWFAAAVALTETQRAVGNDTVDCFGYEQGVMFANGLRVRHRPVFQSYSAYTPLLQEANAASYESPDGPRFVLYKQQPIDEYFPTVQDSQALLALMAGYRPVLGEREYLVLQRRPELRTRGMIPRQPLLAKQVRMGDWVELAGLRGELRLLGLDVEYTVQGRLRSFLLRPALLYLEVKQVDGQVRRFRIAPPIVRAPFLLDPLLLSTQEFLGLFGDRNMPMRVVAFRVLPVAGQESSFAENYGVRLFACDGLRPAPGELSPEQFEAIDRAFWPMFHAVPFRVTAGCRVETRVVDGLKVLFAHAPSELRFHLRTGVNVVSGAFGILPEAWQGEVRTNGVNFHVVRETGSERSEVLQRLLQPLERPDDRGTHRFSVTVEATAGSVLVLATDCGPEGRSDFDWSYWTDVRIESR
ncbi:MAG TPA: hypothetical protein VFD82_00905 [Planctomycetota bacterium]|nr:hypothetical protein [Planctomycetota bacterium]